MQKVCDNIDELFKVQKDDSRNSELEGLSHAFGLLLTHSGANTLLTRNTEVPQIMKKVKHAIGLIDSVYI